MGACPLKDVPVYESQCSCEALMKEDFVQYNGEKCRVVSVAHDDDQISKTTVFLMYNNMLVAVDGCYVKGIK